MEMNKALLAIKPEYVKEILSGQKKYEFRKRLTRKEIDTIIIYSTYPEMRVVGEVRVEGKLEMPPTELWEETKTNAGISETKYIEYFKGCKKACAYKLVEPKIYKKSYQLNEMGIKYAPQSFMYVGEEQYLVLK